MLADRYDRMEHAVGLAFDQLCERVKALWEWKRQVREAEGRQQGMTTDFDRL